MTENSAPTVVRLLALYADELRDARPSHALDQRMDAAIRAFANRPRRSRVQRWALAASLAAGLGALLVGGVTFWILRGDGRGVPAPQPMAQNLPIQVEAPGQTPYSVLPTGQYSLWPTEAAIFRVRASLGAAAAGVTPAQATSSDEQQYWVDVRLANDGTMRIVRIVPADEGWFIEK